eukprot:gene6015-biopygen13358
MVGSECPRAIGWLGGRGCPHAIGEHLVMAGSESPLAISQHLVMVGNQCPHTISPHLVMVGPPVMVGTSCDGGVASCAAGGWMHSSGNYLCVPATRVMHSTLHLVVQSPCHHLVMVGCSPHAASCDGGERLDGRECSDTSGQHLVMVGSECPPATDWHFVICPLAIGQLEMPAAEIISNRVLFDDDVFGALGRCVPWRRVLPVVDLVPVSAPKLIGACSWCPSHRAVGWTEGEAEMCNGPPAPFLPKASAPAQKKKIRKQRKRGRARRSDGRAARPRGQGSAQGAAGGMIGGSLARSTCGLTAGACIAAGGACSAAGACTAAGASTRNNHNWDKNQRLEWMLVEGCGQMEMTKQERVTTAAVQAPAAVQASAAARPPVTGCRSAVRRALPHRGRAALLVLAVRVVLEWVLLFTRRAKRGSLAAVVPVPAQPGPSLLL